MTASLPVALATMRSQKALPAALPAAETRAPARFCARDARSTGRATAAAQLAASIEPVEDDVARAIVRIASPAGTDASTDFGLRSISRVVKCERASPEVPSPSRFRTPVRRAHRPRADLLARSRSLPPARYATRGRSPSPRPRDPPHVQGHLRRDSGCRICLGRLDPNRAALPRRARGAPPGAQLPLVAHQGAQLPEDHQRPLRGAFPGKPARAANPRAAPRAQTRPARFTSNRLVSTPPARDASEPPTS